MALSGASRRKQARGNQHGEQITSLTDGTIKHRGIVFWPAGATLAVVPPAGLVAASNRAFLPLKAELTDLTADAGDLPVSTVTSTTFTDTTVTGGNTYSYVVSAVSATPAESANSIEATVTLAGGNPFKTWVDTFSTELPNEADRDPAADPDKDGSFNLVDFALNGDPADGSDNGAIASLIQNSSLTLIIAVRDGATFTAGAADVDGIKFTVEGSLDLTFPGSAVSSTGSSDTAPAVTGLPNLTATGWEYHTFKLDASQGLSGKRFLRLKVTQP